MAMLQGAGLDGKVLSSAWNVVGFWWSWKIFWYLYPLVI
jgi:hypothetical protein